MSDLTTGTRMTIANIKITPRIVDILSVADDQDRINKFNALSSLTRDETVFILQHSYTTRQRIVEEVRNLEVQIKQFEAQVMENHRVMALFLDLERRALACIPQIGNGP